MGSLRAAENDFSAPPEVITVNGLLFDFDGTIIDSTPAVEKYWHKQAKLIGVDPAVILATSHGRRSIDLFKMYDPSKANWEYICREEGQIPKEFGSDAEEVPGARKLLASLDEVDAPWAVVTSGTRPLVNGWLEVLKLAHPRTLVVAEDVANGKPDPTGYLLGRDRLRLPDTARLVVFEDAPSGVQAGKAAGFRVVGLATSHTVQQVREAGADWIVKDLASIKLKGFQEGQIHLEISNALVDA